MDVKHQRCVNMKYLFVFILVKSAWGFISRNPMENPNLFQGDIIGRHKRSNAQNPMENLHLFQGDIFDMREYIPRNPMENPNLFQGDIIGRHKRYNARNSMVNPNLYQRDIIGRHKRSNAQNPMENLHLFQGDIFDEREYIPRNPMENPYLFQGDIIGMDESERNAAPKDTRLWPGGIIPYKIVKMDDMKDEIEIAMEYIMNRTCIKFVPWDGLEKGYLKIFAGEGCYSYWGRTGGVQPLSLADGCGILGTVLHELMHAIGFDHEQNRSDRDDYLVIYWQNIWPSELDQFDKLKPSENRLINKFDYDSIMLYGQTAFSKDGWSKTMKARKKSIKLIDVIAKGKLSDSDVYRINTLYKCDKKE